MAQEKRYMVGEQGHMATTKRHMVRAQRHPSQMP